jgi:hypothetical protein
VSHNFERLKEHILSLSRAEDFEAAKKEWNLIGFEVQEDFGACPCGQSIKEFCFLENEVTRRKTHVGNVCVKRFIGIDTGNLFSGLRRIMDDVSANANEDLILHAYKYGYIYEREYDFLMSTRMQRILSPKQMDWKMKINRRILRSVVVQAR